jgi:DNA-binding MarR family transcriptional regulator
LTALRVNAIYRFLQQYQRRHKYPPTQAEIADEVGATASQVHTAINKLVGMGAVERRPRYPRGSYIPTEPNPF